MESKGLHSCSKKPVTDKAALVTWPGLIQNLYLHRNLRPIAVIINYIKVINGELEKLTSEQTDQLAWFVKPKQKTDTSVWLFATLNGGKHV